MRTAVHNKNQIVLRLLQQLSDYLSLADSKNAVLVKSLVRG